MTKKSWKNSQSSIHYKFGLFQSGLKTLYLLSGRVYILYPLKSPVAECATNKVLDVHVQRVPLGLSLPEALHHVLCSWARCLVLVHLKKCLVMTEKMLTGMINHQLTGVWVI